MRRWRSRIIAFTFGFTVSLCAVFVYSLLAGLLTSKPRSLRAVTPTAQSGCLADAGFASPEAILAALKSDDVGVRRDMFRRLFLRPNVSTVYYDYERDREYPERAARAELRYVNLGDGPEPEALLTFVRFEQPVALVLQRDACGWQLRAALSAWLRFEDYPYVNWLELPELIAPGTHELLLRESMGDASMYVRKVRVLKLNGGAFTQIAEFAEEEIKRVTDSRAAEFYKADWDAVRQRTATRYTLLPASVGIAPRLRLDTSTEVVKYSGSPPVYTYWLETDGAWHVLARHWRTRTAARLKLLDTSAQNFVWDEAHRQFVTFKQ